METAYEIAEMLLDKEIVKISFNPPFTWTSGIISPLYCDNRKLISYPKERKKITRAFIELISTLKEKPEYIGGTATAAIPWASFVAYELDLPMIYIRPEKKSHGAGKQIEGDLPIGKRVLIIEDLISTGGSSVSAAQAVSTECKSVVTDVTAIVSWELEESKKRFSERGLRLSTLTDFSHIIGTALERTTITQNQWHNLLEFKKNPRKWHYENL